MNAVQLPLLVEALLILVAMLVGVLLSRKAKPYGKVKLGFHLFFFLWLTAGYYFIAQTVWSGSPWTGTSTMLVLMGVGLLVQVATGVTLLVSRTAPKALPLVHGASATLVLIANVMGFFLASA